MSNLMDTTSTSVTVSLPEVPSQCTLPRRMKGQTDYRSLIENLPVLFYVVDPNPPYSPRYVSPAFSRFGYPLEMWTSDPEVWVRIIHPDDQDWVFSQTTESTESGEEVGGVHLFYRLPVE